MVERRQTMKETTDILTLVVFITGLCVNLGFVCVCLAHTIV